MMRQARLRSNPSSSSIRVCNRRGVEGLVGKNLDRDSQLYLTLGQQVSMPPHKKMRYMLDHRQRSRAQNTIGARGNSLVNKRTRAKQQAEGAS